MSKRRLASVCVLVFFGSIQAMEEAAQSKPAVLADINSVVTQNIDKKKEALTSQLKCGTFWLWIRLQAAFGKAIFSEESARSTFFDFLDAIPVEKQYPVVRWQHQKLPRVMAAWILDKTFTTKHVMDRTESYFKEKGYSQADKAVYRAMVKTTFDLETLERTSEPNGKILHMLGDYRKEGHRTYLIGHCTPESHDLIAKNGQDILSKFTGILFSYQVPAVTPQTSFDRAWWLRQLKLPSEQPHIFIDDGSLEPDQAPASPQAESVVTLLDSGRTVSPLRI